MKIKKPVSAPETQRKIKRSYAGDHQCTERFCVQCH